LAWASCRRWSADSSIIKLDDGRMRRVLARLLAGELTVEETLEEIRRTQLLELAGRARVDLGRTARRGIAEVVLAAGKPPDAAARLIVALAREQGQGLGSRLGPDHWSALEVAAQGFEVHRYGPRSALVRRPGHQPDPSGGRAAIISAGTSDWAVAEEARMVLEAAGVETRQVFDVGVAGLHRLLEPLVELVAWRADVIVVAAGMDGILPGVVAGLVDAPVIGVPVPTGYGAGGEGEAALLTMLQSCSSGLTVVNIDNGIGAGTAAALIARRAGAARLPGPTPAPPARAKRSGRGIRSRSSS
jgi:NCAIR mutase (PurE)-related protein